MMVIDAHHHVWDLAVRDLVVLPHQIPAATYAALEVPGLTLVLDHAANYAGVAALARSLVAGLPGSEQAAVLGGTAARVYRIAGQETVRGVGAGSWR
jgi:predicted TIM-barrel fold metal-dependent hydrolase